MRTHQGAARTAHHHTIEAVASTTRRAAAALLAVAMLSVLALFGGGQPAGAAAGNPASAATAAARYVASKVGPDGAVPSTVTSGADLDGTVQTALALAATGSESATLTKVLDFLSTKVDAYVVSSGVDQPGRLARLTLLADATGSSATDFGGVDLIARLRATQVTTGADAGMYGTPNPYGSAFNQGIALAALSAAGVDDPSGIAWLRTQQCDDGSWLGYRANPAVACSADTASTPDSNGTSMAVMGLVAQEATPVHDTEAWLKSKQFADGWGYDGFSTGGDPNSTAIVVQAIIALGGDPASAAWSVGGTSARAALLGFQLGCDRPATDQGALFYDFGGPNDRTTPNFLATVGAVAALAGKAIPFSQPEGAPEDVPAFCEPGATTTTTAPATTTTAPGATSTTAVPTTVPPSTSMTPTTSVTTTAVTAPGGSDSAVLGTDTSRAEGTALATTGASTSERFRLAVALMVIGAALVLATRRGLRTRRVDG